MKKLLQINSGLNGQASNSTKLANEFTSKYLSQKPQTNVSVRDLSVAPVPHLDNETFTTFRDPSLAISKKQKQSLALSDALIEELREADILVLGVPMYNLGIPSTLKAWIDHIARAGVTFRYTDSGVEGLLHDKKAYVVAARGGCYAGTTLDVQTEYLKLALGFIGIHDTDFIYAEGLSMGDNASKTSFQNTSLKIQEIIHSIK